MEVREKLVELLMEFIEVDAWDNGEFIEKNIDFQKIASDLIAHGVTVQEWISVDDRLPEKNVNCIVHYRHAYCDNDGYFAIGFCCYDGEKFEVYPAYKVTHWMSSPEPPKGE